ncbi:hypothetical protein KIL84_009335 [Mauremys mutica]|uniref:Uncharacterized protein n=1 Tax=Mauremys mutica TaxID=74926 RepID=A0A9D3XH84_9SAUR|nr:hypothetical protein KIL84_009335 [Mauremys mutica]
MEAKLLSGDWGPACNEYSGLSLAPKGRVVLRKITFTVSTFVSLAHAGKRRPQDLTWGQPMPGNGSLGLWHALTKTDQHAAQQPCSNKVSNEHCFGSAFRRFWSLGGAGM